MRYELTSTCATFYLTNPRRSRPAVSTLHLDGVALTSEQLTALLNSLVQKWRGSRFTTQRNLLTHFLRPVLAFFKPPGATLPANSNEWQLFLLRFFEFYLVDRTWSHAAPKTRIGYWSTLVMGAFDALIADGVIPRGVVVPAIRKKLMQSIEVKHPTLGEQEAQAVEPAIEPQKLLVDIDIGMTDADYLDRVEASCRQRIEVVRKVCIDHWNALMHDFEEGQRLASLVSDSQIDAVIQTAGYREQIRGGSASPLASPRHPKGHIWALALARYSIARGKDRECVSINALKALPFFSKSAFNLKNYSALYEHTALEQWQFDEYVGHGQFYRFAGLLSALDAAAACCLLTIEHPEFTSDALQGAKLLNSQGKFHLLLTDNAQSSILSVDKPRANQRKSVALTPLAQKLVADIIKWSAPVREVLRRSGDKAWRYLMLGHNLSGRLGLVEGATRLLTHTQKALSLTRLYPALTGHGLTIGRFDYRRIRNTMGVLRWFETGSIQEMSRRLGNSRRVALQHYLPPALLHAWNTRLIRRFQNTLIVLAAHTEDYLLDVTDFSTIADLQHFIVQVIVEYPGDSSPLAVEVQARLGKAQSPADSEGQLPPGLLNIRLSANSLSYLYAFSDLAQRALTEEEIHRVDAQTQLAPIQFIELARLLRHACDDSSIRADLRDLLDLSALKTIHAQAVARQSKLDAQLSSLDVRSRWGHQ